MEATCAAALLRLRVQKSLQLVDLCNSDRVSGFLCSPDMGGMGRSATVSRTFKNEFTPNRDRRSQLKRLNMYGEKNEPINEISTKTQSSHIASRSGDTPSSLIRRANHPSRRGFPSEGKFQTVPE